MNPISTIRQSHILPTHDTIVNQTSVLTPQNTLIKRVIYHTPAIIQTVVDTPQTFPPSLNPPPPPISNITHRSSTQPFNPTQLSNVKRIQSYTSPYQNHSTYLPHPRDISRLNENYGVGSNVKVSQDLRGFREYGDIGEGRGFEKKELMKGVNHGEIKQRGCCEKVLGVCWGNKCPWWVLLLVIGVLVLVILIVASLIKKHRVFYGYDTSSSIGTNTNIGINGQVNAFASVNPLTNNPYVTNNPLISQPEQNVNYLNSNITPINPINPAITTQSQATTTFSTLNPSYTPQIVPPIVSTSSSLTYPQPILQSNTTQTSTNDISGNSIYSRVNTLKQQTPLNPSLPYPPTVYPSILPVSSIEKSTEVTNGLGVRMAPTIEQVETKAMMEADRYNREVANVNRVIHPIVQHQSRYHLRYSLS